MSCIWVGWFALTPEVQAATIGALATAGAALFGVFTVGAQIRSQGRQSRAAIAEGERRKIKAELYNDAVEVCRELVDEAIELSNKLRMMNMELEVAALAGEANFAFNLPAARYPHLSAMYATFADAALRFIFLVENRRIVDPRILIFRTAMSVVLHDSRQIVHNDFVLHVMPIIPTEKPEGGVFPYAPPSVGSAKVAKDLSDKLISVLGDAIAYTEDFLVAMQNALLGDLFGSPLAPRKPADPKCRVVTLENAEALQRWFEANTFWGKEMAQAERHAAERFSSEGAALQAPAPQPAGPSTSTS